jgi:nucleoside phosphorylase/CheY-like chemotaxis protein
VDDNRAKYMPLIRGITGLGIARENIHTAESGSDAKQKLKVVQYDLLILDLCLPEQIEDDPELAVAKELLDQLQNDDELLMPRLMIGFSAYEPYIKEIQDLQSSGSMIFYHHDDTKDDWLIGIINCVKYLINDDAKAATDFPQIDLCIITALYDPEFTAVLDLPWEWGVSEPLDHSTMIRRGQFQSGNKTYSVVAAHALRMGMVSATVLATKLITLCRPRFLVMPGICAGVRDKTLAGDVLLANPSWDYQCGKRLSNEQGSQFYIAPHQLYVHEAVEVRLLEIARDRKILLDIKSQWRGETPASELSLRSGPVGCGSAVLADITIVEDIIKTQQRALLGIEMEIYGVYSAANSSPEPRPITFALKSVCDFADNQKDDRYQKYAAYTSAQLLRTFFETYMKDF